MKFAIAALVVAYALVAIEFLALRVWWEAPSWCSHLGWFCR